jgi:hypothetical protein
LGVDALPEAVKNDLQGDCFIQFDKGCKSIRRFIILFSKRNVCFLNKCKTILIDGTFWSVPSLFKQLVTFNVLLFGRYMPLCYILLSDKSEESYNESFEQLNLMVGFNVKNIICDFEVALINAASKIFKDAKIFGCSFHFGQSVWRKVQSLKLSHDYKHNKEIKTVIRRCLNLMLAPVESVLPLFNELQELDLSKKNENV